MANHLWKATAKKNVAKVVKGMYVEIVKSGTTGKPSQIEIANAIQNKYNVEINHSLCGSSSFDCVEIK
jgi:hypothetical protein